VAATPPSTPGPGSGAGAPARPLRAATPPTPAGSRKLGGYLEREEWLLQAEARGDIAFAPLRNDGAPESLRRLLALKNIFSRQLPNMPKDYIVRLVFCRHHRSFVLLKGPAREVIGGITYRPFFSQRFGEITFCAVSANEQVRGYGTRMMNHLKEHCLREEGLSHFLTYADNNAVGYFAKQGFSKDISMEKGRWGAYIKDYDGGTLMECAMDEALPHTRLPAMVRAQQDFVDRQVRKLSNSHVVHDGLAFGDPARPVPIREVPGVLEAGWKEEDSLPRYRLVTAAGVVAPTAAPLKAFMQRVYQGVVDNVDSWPFKEPVDSKEVPDYYDIVKDPVDLSLIAQRLASGTYYAQLEIFAADFKRMFDNCCLYNAPDTIYAKCARRLESFFEHMIMSGVSFT